VDKKTNSYHC